MATIRFKALEALMTRQAQPVEQPLKKTSEYFAENVFDQRKMKEFLSKEAYDTVKDAIENGTRIPRRIADQVSSGMKAWAVSKGVTHYTHWFHPLTGATAEKHDAFFEPSLTDGVIESFDGAKLVQQEPDASSFPSGGLRNTFEARGYTAWDPSSPAFIFDRTLCIPTIFVSYTGEALDYKTPLLKSLSLLNDAAVEVCQYFDKDVTKVFATLGWEQEYFLVDSALYMARPDLMLTGRTLMGHPSAKDQQLEDHYFGTIPTRVTAFMREFEIEAYKLGIPIKTRHNEVAPNQFECAPVYEEANLAVDHNMLLMDLMKKISRRHNFKVLLHEKPFKGINGSGKHNNWSMATNTGVNLLSPGKNPKSNLQFLTFIVNTIKAVHEHADLLRASIVSAGNEHRLGASEAPPSIISVFLGSYLTKVLDELEERVTDKKMSPDEKTELKLDIGRIPELLLDNTDRNRTSPFAFTGNRFEFRAVGSNANCAAPMTFLSLAVADQLKKFKVEVDAKIDAGVKKDEAILQVLKDYIISSKVIRFDGNGYSQEWVEEAERRGLSNIKEVVKALEAFESEKTLNLCTGHNIFTKRELEARHEIKVENYTKILQIESRVLGDLATNHIIPTVYKYQNQLIENVRGLKQVLDAKDFDQIAGIQLQTIKEISGRIALIKIKVKNMIEARKKANAVEDLYEKARLYSEEVKPYLSEIRYHIDHLEMIVDNEIWPLPKYRELLFAR
ncbi:MAG TPA: glutamine synthetase type III [Marinilabiliales bacterium]|jgi:glutamine synthetase|nr:glutamine synthetase III [Salinivirgaceae bacterium]HAZ03770.1 glutamine synthetase type III [Marinilabiliales bacterium]